MTLAGQGYAAVLPDSRVITLSNDGTVKVWRDGACVRTLQAPYLNSMAVLPGGARFVSGAWGAPHSAKLYTFDGELEHTFDMHSMVSSIAAMPDGAHFVVGLFVPACEVLLCNVDGTLVHTFPRHPDPHHAVLALAVTPDGQHILSGTKGRLVNVWSVATKSLVSTCAGHTGP